MAPLLRRIQERVWSALTPPAMQAGMQRLLEAISESGWRRISPADAEETLDPIDRENARIDSYYYWYRDPLFGRAIRMTRDYTFGRGVTWRAKDERISKVIKRFWDNKLNRIVTRAVGQWELSERMQLAGEVFLMFFVSRYDGHVKVRTVEPGEIAQVITDPDDREKRLFYERKYSQREFSWDSKIWKAGGLKTDYIPDWGFRLPNKSSEGILIERPEHATVGDGKTFVCMHQLKINSHDDRGIPPRLSALPWTKAYKGFMEDRATLTLAAATFAFKQKIKGSAAAVARMMAQWGGLSTVRYGGAGGKERTEGARTLVENESVSLEQMNFDTRSGNAYTDGRMLRQQVSAATDITEQNLTGDPSVANLASATQMEGPMIKTFESWQQLFHDEYVDLFQFVIDMAVLYGDLPADVDRTVEVNFPPIVTKDLATIINAVAQLISAQSMASKRYISDQRLAAFILEAFGETDVDTALQELAFEQEPQTAGGSSALPDEVAEKVQAAIESMRRWRAGEIEASAVTEAVGALAGVLQGKNGNGSRD